MVEYADMECGYCRFRGLQMDQLLEANPKLSYKRYYKFFPLWFSHAWSMKAASAADCIFRFAKAPAMFAFKKQVYAQQAVMTVSGIDELALTFAEGVRDPARGFPRTATCARRASADVRKDLDEGQRLGVKSTPTYFIDGTEIRGSRTRSWRTSCARRTRPQVDRVRAAEVDASRTTLYAPLGRRGSLLAFASPSPSRLERDRHRDPGLDRDAVLAGGLERPVADGARRRPPSGRRVLRAATSISAGGPFSETSTRRTTMPPMRAWSAIGG